MITLLSIGHSNYTWIAFESLVDKANIQAIADVRTFPFSRFPHFCRPALIANLNHAGIPYIYLGDDLGGRPNGAGADYDSISRSPTFLAAIERLLEVAGRTRLAMLCSEHEPLACHRCLLIGRHLVQERGANVRHVLRDGRIEDHAETEERLLALARLPPSDLLSTRAERLATAYRRQEERLHRPTQRRTHSSAAGRRP